ncbi:hypothetical protein K9M41_03210 [Candidatus Gracilibacteria bacterium]|nr:hypothetical protein [Candidatus Gracilibacteria bacterium]
MEILKLGLRLSDGVQDILGLFKQTTVQKIVFICPRNSNLLTDVSFLKKLKTAASEAGIAISFVCEQKFIRDILKSQKLTTHTKVPKELDKEPKKTLSDFSEKIAAKKNETKEPKNTTTKKTKARPDFATQKIQKNGSKPIRGRVFFAFLAVIVILVGVWFWISPRAVIKVKPKISVVPVTQNILVKFPDASIPKDNTTLPTVDGIFVQTEVTGTEVFPATGRRYDLTNARGKVVLFNETSRPKIMVPSRLQAPDGAIFRFAERVEIPPQTEDGAGQLVVEVVADEYDSEGKPIGERGNIEAGTELFFPALRDVSRELWYAKANRGPLLGGSTLTHYFIGEDDFEKVKEVLTETFRVRGIEQLQTEIRNRSAREKNYYVLLDDPRLLTMNLLDAGFPENLIGQEVQTFEVSASLQMSGIVFDQTDVTNFLGEKLRATQDHRKKLISIDEGSADYRVLDSEKLYDDKWLKLSVEMKGVETLDLDSESPVAQEWRENLKKEIIGKEKKEVRSIISNYPEVEKVLDIRVSPFWAENLPNLVDQIEFEIKS